MNPLSILGGSLLAALLLAPPARSQQTEFYGHWDDFPAATGGVPVASREMYVSTTGSDVSGNGTVQAPWATVGFALTQMTLQPGTMPFELRLAVPHTINIAPGDYDLFGGTLLIPAHGVTLETWPETPWTPATGPARRARILNPAGTAISVHQLGNQVVPGVSPTVEMPGSVIHNLEIVDANIGVDIDAGLFGAAPPADPIHVEVRGCAFVNCNHGVKILTEDQWKAFHVIEHNKIEGNQGPISFITGRHIGGSAAFGIEETLRPGAITSTLIRSNDIYWFETGISIHVDGGFGPVVPDNYRPRIASNFISFCDILVNLEKCDAEVINNTIAFATQSPVTVIPLGINWVVDCTDDATLNVYNNILWNPDHFSPFDGSLVSCTDLSFPDPSLCGPSVAFTVNMGSNLIFDRDASTMTPGLVGGDTHPNEFVYQDLHLTTGSTMRDSGDTSQTVLPGVPTVPWFEAIPPGSVTDFVRLDTSMDVDLDPRALPPNFGPPGEVVDRGADEYTDVLLSIVEPAWAAALPDPTRQDAFGNILPTAPGSYGITVYLETPTPVAAGTVWALFLGLGFEDDIGPVPNGPAHQQQLVAGLGNLLLDPHFSAFHSFQVATGGFNAAGQATLSFPLPFVAGMFEAEYYLQMVAATPGVSGVLSNRVQIELNDG